MIKKGRKGVSIIILVFSLFAIVGLSALVLDLGLILNQRYELQKAVESAALLTASEYELLESDRKDPGEFRLGLPFQINITDASSGVGSVQYKALKDYNQLLSVGTDSIPAITFNRDSKAVKIEANATVPTYFMSVLGIREIEIQSKAAAINVPQYLSSKFPRPNGSIVNGAGIYRDTEIRSPVGGKTSGFAHPTGDVYNQNSDFDNIYGRPDGKTLSLGPGGHIMIKLPSTIFDGKGVDFAIYERGHAEGYFVYAGIDIDPDDPYIDAANPGSGINWVNISCTGIPLYVKMDDDEIIGSHRTQVNINGVTYTDYKFYGSGYFDLGMKCDNFYDGTVYDGTDPGNSVQIKNIKYLKIIDDNIEDGFFLQPRLDFNYHPEPEDYTEHAIPMVIPGEHSSFTPGADLDAIEILHHSRLISIADFGADADGDGIFETADNDGDRLINVLEQIYGYDPNNTDTDGDGINDFLEHWGEEPHFSSLYDDSPQFETESSDDITTLIKEYPTKTIRPPGIEIKP